MERSIFPETGLTDEKLQEIERIYIVACGSAYHVGMVGKYVIEELADIPVEVDLASEFQLPESKACEKFTGCDRLSVR